MDKNWGEDLAVIWKKTGIEVSNACRTDKS